MTRDQDSDPEGGRRSCWIRTIDPSDAGPELAEIYRRVSETHSLYRAFSLQPKPLLAADRHYRDILHNEDNESAPWLLELLASQASLIAECDYALIHHSANFKALLGDSTKGEEMLAAVRTDSFETPHPFSEKEAAILTFGAKLCRSPQAMCEQDVQGLRAAGATDTEILEAVQASACFAYWVRFINALGVRLGDEPIGGYSLDGATKRAVRRDE